MIGIGNVHRRNEPALGFESALDASAWNDPLPLSGVRMGPGDLQGRSTLVLPEEEKIVSAFSIVGSLLISI